MLLPIFVWPIFFALGVFFGVISPIIAICKACKEEKGKWQTYVRRGSAVSIGHQKRIKKLAGCLLFFQCCQCGDEDNLRGKKVLLGYYKLGHHLGFSFHVIILTLIKFGLFNPFWAACTASLEDLQKEDAEKQALLHIEPNRPRVSLQRGEPSRSGRVQLKDVSLETHTVTYKVESVRSSNSPKPYSPPPEYNGEWGGSEHSLPDKHDPIYSGKSVKNSDPAEPWGDWGGC